MINNSKVKFAGNDKILIKYHTLQHLWACDDLLNFHFLSLSWWMFWPKVNISKGLADIRTKVAACNLEIPEWITILLIKSIRSTFVRLSSFQGVKKNNQWKVDSSQKHFKWLTKAWMKRLSKNTAIEHAANLVKHRHNSTGQWRYNPNPISRTTTT